MSGEQFDGTADDGREPGADDTGRRDNDSESAPTAPRRGGAFEIDAGWEDLSDDEKMRAVDEMLTELARRMNIGGTAESE